MDTLNADKKKTPLKNQVVCLSTFRRRRRVINIVSICSVSIGKLMDRAFKFISNCDPQPYLTGAAIGLICYLLFTILRLEIEVKQMHRLMAKIGFAVVSMDNKTLKDKSGTNR